MSNPIYTYVTYSYACRNLVNTIMTNETQFFRKIYLSLYSKWYESITKGLCVNGELVTELSCNILTPSSSGYNSTSFSFSWDAKQGTLRDQPLLGPDSHSSNCNHWLQTLFSNLLELPVVPDYIFVCRPPASVSVASALNSTRLQSRLSPYIFDRMHLLFTMVNFLFDSSAGSEVNMLHIYIFDVWFINW